MSALTVFDEAAYLNDGNKCPFCESGDIIGHPVDLDGTRCVQVVHCGLCGAKWEAGYVLSTIIIVDYPDPIKMGEKAIGGSTVNELREAGYCVCIFNSTELDGAAPEKVSDRLVELYRDIIGDLRS